MHLSYLFGSVFPLWQDIRDSPLLLPFEVCVSNDFPWESGNTDMETQRWQGINSLWMVSESIWHWGLKNTQKKQFWKHFTILQGSPKRWKIGVAETLTEYYCESLFKVCNTETKYTLKLSSASRAFRVPRIANFLQEEKIFQHEFATTTPNTYFGYICRNHSVLRWTSIFA